MTHVIYRRGDLLGTECDAIGHGICVGDTMTTGFAEVLKKSIPKACAPLEYLEKNSHKPGDIFPVKFGEHRWVYHIITQEEEGKTVLDFLEQGLEKMYQHARNNGVQSIALPMIGSTPGDLSFSSSVRVLEETAYKNHDIVTELWVF